MSCKKCKKNILLLFLCRCEYNFCIKHINNHNCKFNYEKNSLPDKIIPKIAKNYEKL